MVVEHEESKGSYPRRPLKVVPGTSKMFARAHTPQYRTGIGVLTSFLHGLSFPSPHLVNGLDLPPISKAKLIGAQGVI